MEEEFNNFMLKVEEVGKIVNDLNSNDKAVSDEAARLADLYLKGRDDREIDEDCLKVKKNRTIVNQKVFDNMGKMEQTSMSPEIFMKQMEQDANRRAEDRRLRKQVADGYRTRAIKAFREKEFEKALVLYNKAIDEVRDSCLLYTSRALTCLHLHLYESVIKDCELALKLNENSIKALLYKAKAHQALKQHAEEEKCIVEALEKHPEHIEFIHEYMAKDRP